MTCPTPTSIGHGKSPLYSQSHPITLNRPHQAPPAGSANPLERLAQLVNSNDRLIEELADSRARIVAALSYLDRPDGNVRFGSAHLKRCRTRHSVILAQLRANRVESLDLLGNLATSNG